MVLRIKERKRRGGADVTKDVISEKRHNCGKISIVSMTLLLLAMNLARPTLELPQEPSFLESTTNITATLSGGVRSQSCPQFPCDLSIVFIGDSLSRFMYMSLVHYLRHNQWIEPTQKPNLVRPRDYFSGPRETRFNWLPYYRASTAALAPYEACDCWREPGDPNGGRTAETLIENRYYYDPHRNNTVVYLIANGNKIPMRGHWKNPQQVLQNTTTNPGPWTNASTIPPFQWNFSHWADAILNQVAPLKPHTLVMNAGHWRHAMTQDSYLQRVVQVAKQSVPQVIWRTTTADKKGGFEWHLPADWALCTELDCLNVTGWTSKLDERFYVDKLHFVEPVYRKMNELLLWDYIYPNHPTMKYQYSQHQDGNRLPWSELDLSDRLIAELEEGSL